MPDFLRHAGWSPRGESQTWGGDVALQKLKIAVFETGNPGDNAQPGSRCFGCFAHDSLCHRTPGIAGHLQMEEIQAGCGHALRRLPHIAQELVVGAGAKAAFCGGSIGMQVVASYVPGTGCTARVQPNTLQPVPST